jgi:hypothetical protein
MRGQPQDQWVELSPERGELTVSEEFNQDAALLLRPRSAPQLLDLGVEVVVSRLMACIGICTLIWFPLRAMMPWFLNQFSLDPAAGASNEKELVLFVLGMLAMSSAQMLAAVIGTTAVTVIVYFQLVGRPLSGVEAFRRTLRRAFALLGVFLCNLMAIGLSVGALGLLSVFCPPFFILTLFVYLYLTWKLSVAPSALVLEGLGVGQALRRSWKLTEKSFFRWLGVVFLAQSLVVGLGMGLQVGDNIELRDWLLESTGISSMLFNVVFVGVSAVFAGIATAFTSAAYTSFYLDTRIRREGLDLEMRLDRLRTRRSEVAVTESNS